MGLALSNQHHCLLLPTASQSSVFGACFGFPAPSSDNWCLVQNDLIYRLSVVNLVFLWNSGFICAA